MHSKIKIYQNWKSNLKKYEKNMNKVPKITLKISYLDEKIKIWESELNENIISTNPIPVLNVTIK